MAEVVGFLGPTAPDLQSMNHNYYIALISITILVYDFILTFPAEVERFWFVGRVNWAMCLFCLNRYLVLFGYVPILIENFWVNDEPKKLEVCQDLQAYHEYFSTVVQITIAAMLIMRIYALYGRDVRVLVFLVVISAVLLAIGCWAGYGGSDPKPDDVKQNVLFNVGCGIYKSRYRARRLASTWALLFLFDLIVFGMTLYKTLTFPRSNSNMLITVLVRDGTMYFGIVASCNLINILFLLLGEPLTRAQGVTLTNVLSSVMISRLMLNLRDPSFILASERNAEDTTCPDLTFVESHYPTRFSDGGGFAESESRSGDEAGADLDLHRPASSDIEQTS